MGKAILTKKILLHTVLIIGVLVSIFPFYWLVVMSTNQTSAIFAFPPKLTFGGYFATNFQHVLDNMNFYRALFNTVLIALLSTTLQLFFNSLTGFTFAKFKFPGSQWLFYVMIATMMIPGQMLLVPQFIIIKTFGWVGSYKALIVPGIASAFGIFWIRQYALAIHNELLESARIDGCSKFGQYWRIALPILRPALAFLAITTFMGVWEDYLWPLIVLTDTSKFTLMIALQQLKSVHTADYSMVMTGTLMATLPLIVVFLVVSRQFIAGIMEGAVKS
ncbi:carbohydrate ABC transporter permease [Paenibacillus sp. MWE-103]|uniref:Carbohydrate ABC transporter permease n=1 Tax=Paenibacillus artemisiicola TaxID=1172618 RepID=A0ABS3WFV9_9BACL|nr:MULTISPECIES: carbohydrate ABC transporter permease [Paenibacillus]MBO7747209.1 carbohydrate ABC transporter permease [Paenibacillus artemisiicola]SFJ81231.1 cellobiose transport system permease protein [Paenibacillus sp. UNC496MF]